MYMYKFITALSVNKTNKRNKIFVNRRTLVLFVNHTNWPAKVTSISQAKTLIVCISRKHSHWGLSLYRSSCSLAVSCCCRS